MTVDDITVPCAEVRVRRYALVVSVVTDIAQYEEKAQGQMTACDWY